MSLKREGGRGALNLLNSLLVSFSPNEPPPLIVNIVEVRLWRSRCGKLTLLRIFICLTCDKMLLLFLFLENLLTVKRRRCMKHMP